MTDREMWEGDDHDDTSSIEGVVRRHMDRVYHYVATRLGPGAAVDVTVDVVREARARAGRMDVEATSERSWLLGIAYRIVGARRRDERACLARLSRTADPTIAGCADVLSRMRTQRRDALLLTVVGGLSPREAAEVLGVPAPTASEWIDDGRRQVPEDAVEALRVLVPSPPQDLVERVLARATVSVEATPVIASRPDSVSGPVHRRSLAASAVLALVTTIVVLVLNRPDTGPPPVPEARVDWGMVMTLRMYPPQGVSMEEARVRLTSELASMARRVDAAGTEVLGGEGDRIAVRLPGAATEDEAIVFLFPWSPILNADVDPHDPTFLDDALADTTPSEQEALRVQWEAARHELLQRIFVAPLSSEHYGAVPTIRALPVVASPVDDGDGGPRTMRWHRLAGGRFDGVDYRLAGRETNGQLSAVAVVDGTDASSGPDRVWDDAPVCPFRVGTPRVVVCATEDDTASRTVVHRSYGRVQDGAGRIAVTFAGVTRDAVIEDGWWFARIDVTATPRTMSAADARIVAWDHRGRRIPIVTDPGDDGCCRLLP